MVLLVKHVMLMVFNGPAYEPLTAKELSMVCSTEQEDKIPGGVAETFIFSDVSTLMKKYASSDTFSEKTSPTNFSLAILAN